LSSRVLKIGKPRLCDHCGQEIEPGRAHYRVAVTLEAGFDGVLADMPGEGDIGDTLKKLEKDKRTAKELENEIYQSLELILCPGCRNKLEGQLVKFGSRGEGVKPPGTLTQ